MVNSIPLVSYFYTPGVFYLAIFLVGAGFSYWLEDLCRKTLPELNKSIAPKTALNGIDQNSISCEFIKHVAPNQENVGADWVRICVGAVVRAGKNGQRLKVQIKVYDSNSWRFLDETVFDGKMERGEEFENYPLETHLNIKNGSIRFKGGDVKSFRTLLGAEPIIYELKIFFDGNEPLTHCVSMRRIGGNEERFVLENVI